MGVVGVAVDGAVRKRMNSGGGRGGVAVICVCEKLTKWQYAGLETFGGYEWKRSHWHRRRHRWIEYAPRQWGRRGRACRSRSWAVVGVVVGGGSAGRRVGVVKMYWEVRVVVVMVWEVWVIENYVVGSLGSMLFRVVWLRIKAGKLNLWCCYRRCGWRHWSRNYKAYTSSYSRTSFAQ